MNVDLGSFHGTNRHSHSLRRNQKIWARLQQSNQLFHKNIQTGKNTLENETLIMKINTSKHLITTLQILQDSDPETSGDARAPEKYRRWLWRTSQHPDESEGTTRRQEHLRRQLHHKITAFMMLSSKEACIHLISSWDPKIKRFF